jgi:hypothetical protein
MLVVGVAPSTWQSTAETCRREGCIILTYTLCVQIVGFNKKKHVILHGMNNIKIIILIIFCVMHRWEDNIKRDLQEVGWGGMNWIQLAQGRDRWQALVNAVMNLWVP